MQIVPTDRAARQAERKPIGTAYRRSFGRHYRAMALTEVKGMFDAAALVEIQAIASIPA
jgi:enamine deaminase RidA (YjgF/YER057c/UK114 family)